MELRDRLVARVAIEVDTRVGVSQPMEFSRGETRVIEESEVRAEEEGGQLQLLQGASIGEVVSWNISSSGSRHGSSKIPPSKLRCMRLRSQLYGFSGLASTGIFRSCA